MASSMTSPLLAGMASAATSVKLIPASRPEEAISNPHHVVKNGVIKSFKNVYPSWSDNITGAVSAFKEIFWPLITGEHKSPDVSAANVSVVKPSWLPHRRASDKLRATWLGHACYYVEYPSGLRVLFDPVFDDRCSPLPFGYKRFTRRPCDIRDIPVVDAVVISHSHYDHLSHASVLDVQRSHPDAHFFVGLGLEKWFHKTGIRNVTEMDWWQDADVTVRVRDRASSEKGSTISARVSCLPSQHTSGRTGFDKDATLWCSWAVSSGGRSVWFGGDTGYRHVADVPRDVDDYGPEFQSLPRCPQFKQIGELRGPFDLGLIPIGAYLPRALFSGMHANPFDSVEIFTDTRCRRAMGIHWGTWVLTLEEVMEPPSLLKEALRRKGIPEEGVFDVCDIGESREF